MPRCHWKGLEKRNGPYVAATTAKHPDSRSQISRYGWMQPTYMRSVSFLGKFTSGSRISASRSDFLKLPIFKAWLLSLPPLLSRQVNMADSYEWIFHLFGRHHCKSRIFERMENFQDDCCRLWTKKPFKNSYSRQLRIANTVVSWPPARQIDWPKSVFLQDKDTLFEMMMTT